MNYKIHKKEDVYFALRVFFTLLFWWGVFSFGGLIGQNAVAAMSGMVIVLTYGAMIALFIFFQKIFLIAHMKGQGICLSERQFPEVYRQYVEMATQLGVKKIPPCFILQQGGALNAFAIRFSRKNYIAVYTDIFSVYESDRDALAFVLAHELGHVKRHHAIKNFWTLPALIVPFLGAAHSRACEYTCDNIGAALTGTGKTNGLVLLAGGTALYGKINIESYLESARENKTSAVKFAGLFMSHPYLPSRIENVSAQQ